MTIISGPEFDFDTDFNFDPDIELKLDEAGRKAQDWVEAQLDGDVSDWIKKFLNGHPTKNYDEYTSNWDIFSITAFVADVAMEYSLAGNLRTSTKPVDVFGDGADFNAFTDYLTDNFFYKS